MSGSRDVGTKAGPAGEAGRQARLDALAGYDILDTAAEAGFDDVVLVAAHVCAVPVALVSLVARDRQWFKAKVGLDATETPIEQSVCAHALASESLLVIPDLTEDPRTSDNPLVTGEAGLRFYAGAPLLTPNGVAIGTVCVIDRVPRPEGLTAEQRIVLEALARQVITQLELRRLLRAREDISVRERRAGALNLARAVATEEENTALRANDMRSRFAQEAGRIGTFELDIATDIMTVSPEFCRLYGLPAASTYPAATLEALLVAEDVELRSAAASRAKGDAALDTEYRIRRSDDGNLRWIARRAEFVLGASGKPAKMFGAVHDITERKRVDAHKTALIELGDRLRDVSTREDVAAIASAILGRTLGASRAGYGRVDPKAGRLEIDRDWTMPDIPSIVGRYPLAALQSTVDMLCKGETIVIADIPNAPSLRADAGTYGQIGVRAQIKVPLLERGELVGLVFAHQADTRDWRRDEIELAQGVADRTHLALGKIRAEADQETLNHELSHRLKNTLAMVQAIATQTLRGSLGGSPSKPSRNGSTRSAAPMTSCCSRAGRPPR